MLGRLLKVLQERVKLKKVGRKLFDPAKAAFVDQLEVWPGYSTALVQSAGLSLLNIDSVSKVITNVCVLDVMGKVKAQSTGNLEDALNAELTGKSVMTKYNRRIYRVDGVVLDKTSSDSFVLESGVSTTFQAYYQEKYKVAVAPSQPLLRHVDKKTQRELFLVPELCVMTGLNDQQRADRGLMTRMDDIIKPAAGAKLKKSQELINTLKTQEATRKMIDDWRLHIEEKPLDVRGERLHSGHLLFGDGKRVDPEASTNLDRDSQQKMLVTRQMGRVLVFYGRQSGNEFNSFMQIF